MLLIADPAPAVQRVVLLSYDRESGRVSFRHYSIAAQPSGVTKGVKALVGQRRVPDLSALQDVADYLTRSGFGSVCTALARFPQPTLQPYKWTFRASRVLHNSFVFISICLFCSCSSCKMAKLEKRYIT